MLEIVNSIVLVTFGILMGVLAMVTNTYEPQYDEKRKMKGLEQREGESFLHYLRRSTSREYRDEENEIRGSMPKPYQRATLVLGFLVFMLIIVLIFSPLYMNWLIFIGSILVGIFIYKLIFYLAKAGKIKVAGESFLDIPLPGKPSLDTKENQRENINI